MVSIQSVELLLSQCPKIKVVVDGVEVGILINIAYKIDWDSVSDVICDEYATESIELLITNRRSYLLKEYQSKDSKMKRPLISQKNEQLIQQWADLHYAGNFTLAVNKLIEAQLKHNDLKESKND